MSKIQVYISYSRSKENSSGSIVKMLNALKSIDFKIDTKEVGVRDDFKDFISKIGEAKHIIVVFSEAYFKSFYCMYELLKIIQHGGKLKDRVFIVREEEYFLTNIVNQTEIKAYWKKVVDSQQSRTSDLTPYGSQAEVEEIHSELGVIIGAFATVNGATTDELTSSTYESLFSNDYQAILSWLKETKEEIALKGREPVDDKKFIIKVTKNIEELFDECSELYESINKSLNNRWDKAELAIFLCEIDNQIIFFNDHLIGACKKAVKLSAKGRMPIIINTIKRLLNNLCVMAVSSAWSEQEEEVEVPVIAIHVETDFGATAAAGRRVKVIPYLQTGEESQVKNKNELSLFKSGTWDNSKELVVDALLRFVYDSVMHAPNSESKTGDPSGKITDIQRKQLNTRLILNAEHGESHFYCMLRKKETAEHFINTPGIVEGLKKKLPALDIFILKMEGGGDLFLVMDESELSETYHWLLNELDEWGKK